LRLVNMRFECVGAIDLLEFNICNNVEILNCDFAPADNDVVSAISTVNSSWLTIRNCRFSSPATDNGFDYCLYAAGGSNKNLHCALIENNIFDGMDGDGTAIHIEALCTASQTVIRNNLIMIRGAGIGIDDDSDQAMVIENKIFHNGGTPLDVNASLSLMNMLSDDGTVTWSPTIAGLSA
ncbi:unnamed protein product, partial [marine sediment metagenome]